MQVKLVGELVADACVFEKRELVALPSLEELGITQSILVVDDEPDTVTFLTTFFEDNGFKTLSANNAEQAERIMAAEKPDLVTLDIIMPGMSGVEFYRQIRKNGRFQDVPVVMITGVNPENPGHMDARTYVFDHTELPGPEGYLEKPVNKELLLMTVRKLLEQRKSAKER
jgi:CheY-like chemotaxis protein